MAIDINSLFADIIDTPEQRQQKLLQQGMVQGQLLSSGLRGRAAALAPLAQMGGQLGVQRNDALRRAVQPMIGIDPRSTGERVSEQLQGLIQKILIVCCKSPRLYSLPTQFVRLLCVKWLLKNE